MSTTVVSEGKRFRELIVTDEDGNCKTVHQERKANEWIARYSIKSYNVVKEEKKRYPRRTNASEQ